MPSSTRTPAPKAIGIAIAIAAAGIALPPDVIGFPTRPAWSQPHSPFNLLVVLAWNPAVTSLIEKTAH